MSVYFETPFAQSIVEQKYSHTLASGKKESWPNIVDRVTSHVMSAAPKVKRDTILDIHDLILTKTFMPGGRYLAAAGREYHQVQNCLLLRAEDSREGWGELVQKATLALSSGAGIGVDYSDVRPYGTAVKKTGGFASGPVPLMQMVNEVGRGIMNGGNRRAAMWAGLKWSHPDIMAFIAQKNWRDEIKALKLEDYSFPATMDMTNISVQLDDEFFKAYYTPHHDLHGLAHKVYDTVVRQMLETGEPGFAIDIGDNAGETLRNACTEVTSRDDSDICNLGSINLARVHSVSDMARIVELGTVFLLAGTLYSDTPYPKVAATRNKNRRLGLGVLGLHEWLLTHGKTYGPDAELEKYLEEYALSGSYANQSAWEWGITMPTKTRAIAPTGTIGILAETTTGIEPIFSAAFKRRYLDGDNQWAYQYVIDPTAKRLLDNGVDAKLIEDAYSISTERRLGFQAWVQKYVDHGISSTVNLPAWGSSDNNPDTVGAFSDTLIKYLPRMRGITVYPDGARGGQPLNPVSVAEAMQGLGNAYKEGSTVVEGVDLCDITKGESCGS